VWWRWVPAAAGNPTPSIYEINGRGFMVIVCGGGKNGTPSGSSIVAFAH
jgi:quinoprotein glucose dehydrogenase